MCLHICQILVHENGFEHVETFIPRGVSDSLLAVMPSNQVMSQSRGGSQQPHDQDTQVLITITEAVEVDDVPD